MHYITPDINDHDIEPLSQHLLNRIDMSTQDVCFIYRKEEHKKAKPKKEKQMDK